MSQSHVGFSDETKQQAAARQAERQDDHSEEHLPPHRRVVADELFKAFDLDGNGAVGLAEMTQVLDACKQRRKEGKPGAPVDAALERSRAKWLSSLKSQIRQMHEQVKRRQSAASFNMKSGIGSGRTNSDVGQIHFMADVAQGDGDPSLSPDAFAEFIRVFAGKYSEDDFATFVTEMRAAVEQAYENTMGSKKKKMIWELFQLMDVNHDSLVDVKELSLLLHVENKKDKKSIARFKALLKQRKIDHKRAAGSFVDLGATAGVTLAGTARASFSAGSPDASGRKKSVFVTGDDGILTIKDEDVTGGHDSDDDDDESPPLLLRDFQKFLNDFFGDNMDRLEAALKMVRAAIQETHRRYLTEMKVDEIMNDILEDLLRERPHDVLDGIVRSVGRLRRLGHFPTKAYRSMSIMGYPFAREDGGETEL